MMKMLRKSAKPIISLLVILSMVLSLPTPVIAQTMITESIDSIPMSDATSDEAEVVQGNIIGEDMSKRDEFTKYFITDAGTTIAAQYAVPVHYKDDNGEYADYDNSLTSSQIIVSNSTIDEATKDEVSVYDLSNIEETPQTEEVLVNKKSDTKVSHYKKSGKANLIEIERDGHKISWGYSGANIVSAEEQENKTTENLTGNDAYLALSNLSSTVLYENIYNNVDLEVINSTTGVKENLILKASNVKNVFKIEYSIGELTAESVDSQTIELKNTSGKVVYTISAPYMKDANGETSKALELKILSNNKGKLSVKLTADKTWLKDKTRVYPVTIDPWFTYGQDWGVVESTFINENEPSESYGVDGTNYQGSLYIGRPDADSKLRRSLIKIVNPETSIPLNNSDMIVGAQIALAQVTDDLTETIYVGVYEAKSSWTQGTATWSNPPDCSSELIDYEKIPAGTQAWRYWDVTELVKKWYNGGTNYGMYLKAINEIDVGQGLQFTSASNPEDVGYRPFFVLTYRNNKGIEDRWSYTTIDCGKAGTAYINDYSGNLVFNMPLASTASPVLSAPLSYTYNSYCADIEYSDSTPIAGKGWKMNIQQTVYETTDTILGENQSEFPYVYTDDDGTEHYFCPKVEDGVTKYYDEDGLNLELQIIEEDDDVDDETAYLITNKDDDKYHFNSDGNLYKIENKAGQSVTINYSGEKITSIVDAEGNVIYINKDVSGNYLKKITDPDSKVVNITLTNKRITKVTYNDGTSVAFTYDSAGKLLSVTDVDGAKVVFTYSSNGSKGVTSVTEYGKNGTQGQKMTFDRTKYNTTTIRTPGVDGVYGNTNDMLTIYQFDNHGKTVSVNCQLKSGSNIGAGAYTYTASEVDSTASNIKKLNRISSNFSLGANRENIVKNHNMEILATDGTKTFSDWGERYWIANTVDFDVESNTNPNNVLYGQKSMKLTVNSASGDARGRVYQNIDAAYLTQGKTYTLSAYVKTENITPVAGAEDYGALICITPLDSDDNTQDIYSEHISQDTDIEINKGFRRISVTFKAPTNNSFTGVRIQLALRAATGTVYFDGVQLEKASDAPSAYNMLENASFERTVTDALPENWSTKTLSTNDKKNSKSTTHRHEKLSVTFKGAVNDKQNIYQDVPVSGSEADTYILSGWAKAPSVPEETNNSCFELRVKIYYSDGTDTTKYSAKFNTTISDWQFTSFAFNLDNGDDTEDIPTKIGVYLIYYYQGNSVLFDNIQLTKEPVPSYTYDNEGNLISVVANAEQNSTYKYVDEEAGLTTKDHLVTQYTSPNNKNYDYKYFENKQLKSVTTPTGLTANYTYDSKGNTNSVELSNGDLKLSESLNYTYNNGTLPYYTVEAVNQRGKVSSYRYNVNDGTLTGTTDPNGNTTTYSYYTTNDTPKKVTSGDQSVTYAYDSYYKHRTGITHGNTSYSFTYDEFGNPLTTSVGNRTLSTNTYKANNGSLQKLTFGNNDKIEYAYDNFGNIKELEYNDVVVANNYTDASGNVIRSVDKINNLEYRASFDSLNRLAFKDVFDLTATGTRDKWVRSVEQKYDLLNNISQLTFAYKDGTHNTTNYFYDSNNRPFSTMVQSGKTLRYFYDGLDRVTGSRLNTATPIETEYTFINAGTKTTNVLCTEISNAFAYQYTYDNNGNITAIDNGEKLSNGTYRFTSLTGNTYNYDRYNQLTKDTNYITGDITTYTYDTNGNITQKEVANGQDSTITTYTYGDSSWGDLLTKYNGQSITYDAIGNPLTYRDGIQLTWQNGRELASFEDDDVTVNYTYDPSGLRTKKAVTGGITTKYVYEGGLLVQMRYGSNIFDFNYDANDRPIGFRYTPVGSTTGAYYYYGVNSRGDIESLYNSSGTQIASYSYDAYGKPLSTTTLVSGYSTVISVQPLRYRSYVYDTETGLYYLQSRYYDPTTCRFINADVYYETGQGFNGYNMFAYCNNNPVMFSDPLGTLVTYSGVTYSGQEFHNVPAYQLGWLGQIKEYSIDSVVYDVPLYCQGETNLCWAYSQTMIEDYNSGITKTQEEADQRAYEIAIEKHGLEDWDKGSKPTNRNGPYNGSIEDLCSMLYEFGPLYASYGYYFGGERYGGHAIVITGVDTYNYIVYTNNPWGSPGRQSYSDFLINFVGNYESGWQLDGYYYLY